MDADVRGFIESATLLFIASQSPEGKLDVSPRGGQPHVLWPDTEGRLLLPDYMGNRRLDTIGNVLGNPEVVLAVLCRGANRFLRLRAHAEVSTREEDIAMFPADQNKPMTALVFTPHFIEFVKTEAFERADFWLDPSARKPPLDMMAYYHSDKAMHLHANRQSVARPDVEESRLDAAGMRDIYGTPSEVVRTKVYDAIGPGGLAFIDEACFVVIASAVEGGLIDVDLLGGEPMRLEPTANRQIFRLMLPPEVRHRQTAGECAVIATVPGRCEALRMNGPCRPVTVATHASPVIDIAPDEIFFHCSAALTRSRIWAEPLSAAWSGLRRFTIAAIREENPEVKSFELRPGDSAPIGDILPGQYVSVAVTRDPSQSSRRRNYSISGRPQDRVIRISVRRVSEDGLSGLLHDLAVGDEVQVDVPRGRFLFESARGRPVVLVSAGVGITPLLPMLEAMVTDCVERDIWFVHAARDARHHLFAGEARDLASRGGGRVRLFTAYSRADDDEPCDHRGRVDADLLNSLVPASGADFYICGPDAFMKSLHDGLVRLGAASDSIRFETFAPGGDSLAQKLAGRSDRKVMFARSAKELTWQPSSGSLLDLALANGVEIDYSCRVGDCQSCMQTLIRGTAEYPAGDVPVLVENQVLLCQAVPESDIVLDC